MARKRGYMKEVGETSQCEGKGEPKESKEELDPALHGDLSSRGTDWEVNGLAGGSLLRPFAPTRVNPSKSMVGSINICKTTLEVGARN